MANDSPGEALAAIISPVEAQSVVHVGDQGNSGVASGGRDEEDPDNGVNRDSGADKELQSDQALNVQSIRGDQDLIQKDSADRGHEGGIKDAILGGTEDEIEQTTARISQLSTGSAETSGENTTSPHMQSNVFEKQGEGLQVENIKSPGSLGSFKPQNSSESIAQTEPHTRMEDAPDIVPKENLPLAPSEDIGHVEIPHSGPSAPFEESPQQDHTNATHGIGHSHDQRRNASIDVSHHSNVPLIEGQLQYPPVQISPANPAYEGPDIITASTATLISEHRNNIEPNSLAPFPSVRMNTPPPPLSEMNAILALTYPFPSMEPVLPQQQEGRRIDAYVKLCFDDGNVYYIKNAAVIFGRAESSSQDRAINRNRNKRGSKDSKEVRGHQRKSSQPKKAKSTASSASFNGPRTPNNSRRTSIAMTTHTGLISSYNESARPFFTDPFTGPKPQGYPQGLSRLDEEALIHLPPTGEPARKNISRRHARLSFNAEKEVFELQVMGKNGAFVENEWVECGSTLLLHKEGGHVERSGEKAWRIQIGGVGFALVFPPRDPLENEESGVAAVGKEGEEGMSLAFLDGSGREITTDVNEEEEEDEDAEEKEELEEEEEDDSEEGGVEEEEIDSELEAEENAYAMAPSAEDLSDDNSMDGYEEDDEGLPPPVRGKSFLNGYPAAFTRVDGEDEDEEGEEDGEDMEEADDEEGQPHLNDVEEDGDEDDEDDDDLSSSSGGEDDGDDYVSGPARKRKKPLPQTQKPIARKNIKVLEALKRPKSSPEPDPKRSKGRPKKTVASKGVSKKPVKGIPKKQLTPQQQERERKKQEKAKRAQEMKEREFRDRQERLRQLQEEERKEQEQKRKELEKREVKAQKSAKKQAREELIRERELKKEKQLRDVLKNKELQKSLNEAEKAEKARLETERHEKRLLERQEKLMREARDRAAAAQATRRAQEVAADNARKNAKIQLPSTSLGETPKTGTSSNLPPLQLPTISAAPSVISDAPKKSPSHLSPDGHHTTEQLSAQSGYNEYNHFPIDPSLNQFDHSTYQHTSSHPPPTRHPSIPNQFATVKEPRQPKPPKEPKPKKEKPPPKRKRSPSPPINEADFPPEALLKPNASYLILIHEAISNSEKQMLSLPDIYRAIQRKYPYFKLRVTTTGWQSSVRHNLSQSAAFERVQREGKGWLWKITEGFNIEKEKKKKLLPPPPLSQIIHPHHGHYAQMVPGPNGMPMMAYGVVPNQQGVPLSNGMYMGVRPSGVPGVPSAAPTYPNQPQMVPGGVVQPQYPVQPNQYPQPLQQPVTPIPNTQSIPPSNLHTTTPVYTQGMPPAAGSVPVGATAAATPRSSIPRAPIPPPPLSNATRIQMAQLASQRPPEQRPNQIPVPPPSQLPPPPPPPPPLAATPPAKSVHIDDATLIAFRDVIDNAERQMKAGGLNSMPGTNFNQLRTLITIALDPTSPESAKSRQLLGGALQLVQQNQKAQKDQQGKTPQGPIAPGKAPITASVTAQPAGAAQRPVEAEGSTGVQQAMGSQQAVGILHAVQPQALGSHQAIVPQSSISSGGPTASVVKTSPIVNAPMARTPVPTPTPAAASASTSPPVLSAAQKSPTQVTTVPLSNTATGPSGRPQSPPKPQPSENHPQPPQQSQLPLQPSSQSVQQTPSQPKIQPQSQSQSQPQSQFQADSKPATTGPPKATSQQIMNLLARLKKQKQAQQQAQGLKASTTSAAVSSPLPSPAPAQLSPTPQPSANQSPTQQLTAQQSPVQQPPVQQTTAQQTTTQQALPQQLLPPYTPQSPVQQGLKRSIELISSVTSPEIGDGAVVLEGPVAKKIDDGEGKRVEVNLEAPVDSQPQNNEKTT